MIESEKAFESCARSHGVNTIKGCHANNGIFQANAWREECIENKQQSTFAGVKVHHTNGAAEKRIGDSQDSARTTPTHSNKRWPKAATASSWPCDI